MEFFDSNAWDQPRHAENDNALFENLHASQTHLSDSHGSSESHLAGSLEPIDGHIDGHIDEQGPIDAPIDGAMNGSGTRSMNGSMNGSMRGSIAGSLGESHGLPDPMHVSLDRSISDAMDPLDPHDQYFSPALSFQGTPLLSPSAPPMHSIAYQMTPQGTPQGTPHGTPQLAPQAQGQATSPAVNEFGMYYAQRMRGSSGSGKVSKPSPTSRWRAGSLPEDEFRLGDPAIEMAEPAGNELDERLRSAIQATAKANSRANSVASIKSGSSRRASASGNTSTRTTPRIRPKISEISPNIQAYDGEPNDEMFLKSNYQHLLDGTHQHLELATADRMVADLRSKKAVHKLAEQERRNRMNTAITELSALLGPGDDKVPASKAATVERATLHIKKLQEQVRELESKLKSKDFKEPK